MVDLALKNLLHDRVRFLITISGVAFAVALVVFQVGLFVGLLGNATVTIDHIDADLWVTSRNTPNVDLAHAFPDNRVERVRSIPGVARADNLLVLFMNVSLPTGAEEMSIVYALDDFAAWHLPWDVAEGDAALLRSGAYVMIDDSARRRFGPFEVGQYREYLGRRLKIVGRTRGARSFTTTPISFVDFRMAQQLSPEWFGGQTSFVLVRLAPGAEREAVRAEIQRRLPHNDVYTGTEWATRSRKYWTESTGLGFNMFLTVFLGCLVGVVVVALTLYTSTMEHLREYGTLKAIGASNADIYRILARQATLAAVIGYVVGIGPAWLSRYAVARMDLSLVITPELAATTFLGTVALCLLSAMVSFRKVAGIDPALVFRQ